MVCMCVFSFMREHQVKPLDHFDVLTLRWKQTLDAVSQGLAEVVKSITATSENHPQSSVALMELHNILPHQRFACAGDLKQQYQGIGKQIW